MGLNLKAILKLAIASEDGSVVIGSNGLDINKLIRAKYESLSPALIGPS